MSDAIALRGIRAHGRVGANPGERDRPQPLDVDVVLALDLARARASDALEDTLDYAALHAAVVRVVETRCDVLLERLAEAIAAEAMRDARVLAAQVTVAKPGLLAGATPSVTVRSRRTPAE